MAPADFTNLIATAIESEAYCPTLSRPEQQADADAFDEEMARLGSSKKAWRGSRVAA